VDSAVQIDGLRRQTGCDAVMVGRAALADPFIFRVAAGGPPPGLAEAARWPQRYHRAVEERLGAGTALAKLKQQLRWYRAGGLFDGCEEQRQGLLRCGQAADILAWLEQRGGTRPDGDPATHQVGR
jgi:tRNA-dihydrouridine synthase